MARGKTWTDAELLIAMNLYCKLPFGLFHRNNPLIIEVAQKLGRTPSSLAMKLCNLASLDPYHRGRGVKGLTGASRADQEMWAAFHSDWVRLGVVSEEKLQRLLGSPAGVWPARSKAQVVKEPTLKYPANPRSGPTEVLSLTKARLGQTFFRQSVLASYGSRCCITGNPIPELLVASHILPWRQFPEHRLNPSNGLCLAQTQDAAFDKGLMTLDENFRVVLSPYLRDFLPNEALERSFLVYEGKPIQLPEKFLPGAEFVCKHREQVFRQ